MCINVSPPLFKTNNSGFKTAISDNTASVDRTIRSGFPSIIDVSAIDTRHLTILEVNKCGATEAIFRINFNA
jgi:hypothetical protein